LQVNIGDDDMAALADEGFGDIQSNAIGGTGDDGDFIFKILHGLLLLKGKGKPWRSIVQLLRGALAKKMA
jgi:hypothetical protein